MTAPERIPVALVTGGARRVGRASALALAEAGCDVFVTWHTSREEAEEVARAIEAIGRRAMLIQADLASGADLRRVIDTVSDAATHLDVLVHNASMYGSTPFASVDAEVAVAHYRVNALAPLLLTQGLAPLLRRAVLPAGGCVIAMLDIHATGGDSRPRRHLAAYALSKAALSELVRVLALELAPKVRVNGVAPGVVAFPETGPESEAEMQEAYLSRVPLGRAGTPHEAAGAVRWLAFEATYCTGQVIKLDGGRELR